MVESQVEQTVVDVLPIGGEDRSSADGATHDGESGVGQWQAEREKRAKVTLADGELQAAQRLADAAATLSSEPSGLQLRYLQTLAEIAGGEKSSTTIFPVPIDLVRPFYDQLMAGGEASKDGAGSATPPLPAGDR